MRKITINEFFAEPMNYRIENSYINRKYILDASNSRKVDNYADNHPTDAERYDSIFYERGEGVHYTASPVNTELILCILEKERYV